MIGVGGENLIDLVSRFDEGGLPVYTAYPGGSPFNVAMAAGRQGVQVAYLTPVSTDRLGDLLAERLTDCGVHLVGGRSDKPTSLAVVSLQDGHPSYGFYRQDTADRQVTSAQLDKALPESVQIFHVGSAALIEGADADAWEDQFSAAATADTLTSLDPNIRPPLIVDEQNYRTRLRRMMDNTDLLKMSDEDLLWLYPDKDFEAACSACFATSRAALTIITCGADGVLARCGTHSLHLAAFPVDRLVDTVGAGDTFMASLLVWCVDQKTTTRTDIENLSKQQLEAVLSRAAAAAALNCRKQGCQPPTKDEINAANPTNLAN